MRGPVLSSPLSRVSAAAIGVAACLSLAVVGCSASSPDEAIATTSDAVTSVCGGAAFVRGVDVSEWQGEVDWLAMRDAGNVFAFTRIGDGLYEDPTFETNWAGIHAVGMLRGAYQYFEPATDPIAQADIVVRKVGKLAADDLPVAIDVETTNGLGGDAIAAAMAKWLARVEAGTGKKPIIYTGGYFWEGSVGSSRFGGFPLWTAHYDVSCPNVPAPWPAFRFWQYSTTNDTLDRDVFGGTLAELRAFAHDSVSSIPSGSAFCPYGPGLYCGGNGVGGDPSTLYSCTYGRLTTVGLCASTCRRMNAGEDDACADGCPSGGGHYCGGDGVAGDPSTLYQCTAGVLAPIQACANGCLVTAAGAPDRCR